MLAWYDVYDDNVPFDLENVPVTRQGTRNRGTSLEVPAKSSKLNPMGNLWMVHKNLVSKETHLLK